MPAKFTELIRYLKEEKSGANDVVSAVCGIDCGQNDDYENPTATEVVEFLRLFADTITLETSTKEPGNSKKLASTWWAVMNQIADWVEKNTPSKFLGIDPAPFAFKLALRVRKPKLLQQSTSRLCGPTAVLYSFGKTEPAGFAKLGMDLLSEGAGSLRNLKLTPSPQILSGFPLQKTAMSSADYVLLVSFRQCADVAGLGEMSNVISETTTAGTICRMLTDAGYTDVQDHTFLNHGSFFDPGPVIVKAAEKVLGQKIYHGDRSPGAHDDKAIEANLKQAAAELAKGRFVLIQGHGDIAKYLSDENHEFGSANAATRTMNRHWTAVRKIIVESKHVHLRLITWGSRVESRILRSDLFPRYDGFVSAKP